MRLFTVRHRFLGLGVVLALLLAGCGAGTPSGNQVSPEAVHTQWVAALRDNDRHAALAVHADSASELIAAEVDRILRVIQQELRSGQISYYRGEDFGPFQQVTTLPVQEHGAGRVGVSVWSYATQPMCYRTTLAQTTTGWRVTQWDPMQKGECAAAIQRTP